MANTQLTAYVSAQLDKGVSREAITQALIGAGWMAADVEAAVGEVVTQRGGATSVSVTGGANPAVTVQTQPAQGLGGQPATTTVTTSTSPAGSFAPVTPASFFATTPSTPVDGSIALKPHRSMSALYLVVGVLLAIAIIGGLAYAFLMGGEPETAVADPATAQQLATLQQERDQLKANADTLTASVRDLENQLGIFAATTTASLPLTIRGTLATTTAGTFTLTTSHDIVLTVSNGTTATVAAALTPLRGAEVELTGTHAPASTALRVTAVNGAPIAAPAATSTATTTAL